MAGSSSAKTRFALLSGHDEKNQIGRQRPLRPANEAEQHQTAK
jgi:hypothetical protein